MKGIVFIYMMVLLLMMT